MRTDRSDQLGATPDRDGRCRFRVWAPRPDRIALKLLGDRPRLLEMARGPDGYAHAEVENAPKGTRYFYRLDDTTDRPDPASRSQPEGVHGPSEIVSPDFPWTPAAFLSPPLHRHILYELHVGTFTPEGTFDAIIPRLDDLRMLGITAVELMPIAQFSGGPSEARNWGYDGAAPFAAQSSYGGPEGLRRLVDAAHQRSLAVFLDVVYNHLGPEGCYLPDFGPYLTDRYATPWGPALNFDGPDCDPVREFFIQSALYWTQDCRIDGLRLDAVHAIVDPSPLPFIEELTAAVHAAADRAGRRIHIIAESAANDPRLVRPAQLGGQSLDAVWNDDFHHALRTLLTGERHGYYDSYGQPRHLARAYTDGFVYTGEHSPFHRRRHGRPARDIPTSSFIVFSQNHDQIGNRIHGDRLNATAGLDAARLAAGAVLLSPFTPLLFMGEEYAETAPFQYFTSHTDPALAQAVRRGRREEFAAFAWTGETPDPQDPETFRRSKLDWSLRGHPRHRAILDYYARLIDLRRTIPALAPADSGSTGSTAAEVHDAQRVVIVHRTANGGTARLAMSFSDAPVTVQVPQRDDAWVRVLDSSDRAWGGPGPAGPPPDSTGSSSVLALPPRTLIVDVAPATQRST